MSNTEHTEAIIKHFSQDKFVQNGALDNVGQSLASHPKLKPLEVESIRGKKEEMYWDKVPEKIRMQALVKARESSGGKHDTALETELNEGKRKSKRRKHV